MTITEGFLLSLTANILTGASQVLQKKALLRLSGKEGIQPTATSKSQQKRYLDLEWICGISLSYLGDAFNFLAYSKCNPALLSPLGIVSILTSLGLASFYLKERISERKIRGYSIALIGVVFLILSSHQAGTERIDVSSSPLSYFSVIFSSRFSLGFLGLVGVQSILIYLALKILKQPVLLVFIFILSLFAAISITAGKLVSIYFSTALYHYTLSPQFIGPVMESPSIFQHIVFLIIISSVLISSTILNEVFRQKCLDSFPVVMFYPLFYCGFNASVILASIYFWSDWTDISVSQFRLFFAFFIIGMCLVGSGLIFGKSKRNS